MIQKILNKLRWLFNGKCITCGGTFQVISQEEFDGLSIYGPIIITKLKCDECNRTKTIETDNDPFTFP